MLSQLRYTHILFDLDGTLTDPKEGITRCLQYAIERLDGPRMSREELLFCIGPPLRKTFPQLLQTEDEETIEQAVALYRERFSTVGLFENEVYPDIPETLTSLQDASNGSHEAFMKFTFGRGDGMAKKEKTKTSKMKSEKTHKEKTAKEPKEKVEKAPKEAKEKAEKAPKEAKEKVEKAEKEVKEKVEKAEKEVKEKKEKTEKAAKEVKEKAEKTKKEKPVKINDLND